MATKTSGFQSAVDDAPPLDSAAKLSTFNLGNALSEVYLQRAQMNTTYASHCRSAVVEFNRFNCSCSTSREACARLVLEVAMSSPDWTALGPVYCYCSVLNKTAVGCLQRLENFRNDAVKQKIQDADHAVATMCHARLIKTRLFMLRQYLDKFSYLLATKPSATKTCGLQSAVDNALPLDLATESLSWSGELVIYLSVVIFMFFFYVVPIVVFLLVLKKSAEFIFLL